MLEDIVRKEEVRTRAAARLRKAATGLACPPPPPPRTHTHTRTYMFSSPFPVTGSQVVHTTSSTRSKNCASARNN